jgi:hypothetical protein
LGISSLQVPNVDGDNPKTCKDWKTVDTPSTIMAYQLACNQGHFGQADGPLTIPPMSEAIDYSVSTAACNLMLKGDFNTTELEELTQLLVKHFLRQQTLQVWNEGTSTLPSDINLGHYNALSQQHKYKANSPEAKAFEIKQE